MVRQLAFARVEEDADGVLQLSRTVVLADDMTWHVQVCSCVHQNKKFLL